VATPRADGKRKIVMLNKFIFGSFALILLFTVGCSSPVRNSGFLSGYERLHQGRYLKKYWADAGLNQTTIANLSLEEIDSSRIMDCPTVSRDEAVSWLKAALISSAQAQPNWQISETPSQAPAKLSLAITYLTPGSAGDRIFAGELGLGNAFVQVEGKLVNSSSGQELAAFADRRQDSGSMGLEDTAGDAGPKLVKRMLEKLAADIVRELATVPK
jgi:hypothetical protein